METSSTTISGDMTAERKGEIIPVTAAAQGCCDTVGSGASCCGGSTATLTNADDQDILTTVSRQTRLSRCEPISADHSIEQLRYRQPEFEERYP